MPRRLGQHFLIDASVIQRIVKALDIQNGDTIIEIGPGHGELTKKIHAFLLENNITARVIAVEKDPRLALSLERTFADDERVTIIQNDARKIVSDLFEQYPSCKLVGNIPYYITGRLLRLLGEHQHKPILTVFTIQKEVAERITAEPPRMNLLAATVQIWCTPRILTLVPREKFRPPPDVDSAVILLSRNTDMPPHAQLSEYFDFVRTLFKQPRKTIVNNLHTLALHKSDVHDALAHLHIPENARPQNLSVSDIQKLQKYFTT